jgi:hypothetical protein
LAYQGLSSFSIELLSGIRLIHRRVKRKRSKGLVVLLLPALIFIGLAGWLTYALGSPEKKRSKRKQPKEDSVTMMPIVFEEQPQINNRE